MSVGPVAPSPGGPIIAPGAAAGPGPAPAAVTADLTAAVPAPATAPSALDALISESVAAQDGLAPLLADLEAAAASPALPANARAAIQQILAAQAPLDPAVTSQTLRTAMAGSGLFLEAVLAAAATRGAEPPDLTGDLKAQMLRLPTVLDTALQLAALQGAPPPRPAPLPGRRSSARPPPPARNGATAGQPAALSGVGEEDDAPSLAHALVHGAQAALARLQLSQIASLPRPGEPTRWTFELPVAAPDGRAVAQFEIRRETPGAGHAAATWRVRFSLDMPPAGPVHAEVALSDGAVRTTLWAEGQAAHRALTEAQGELVAALAGPEGADAAVRVLEGRPPEPEGRAGQLVDRSS